jgi:RNA polymerase sigma-70 factor (ECF subfamily)
MAVVRALPRYVDTGTPFAAFVHGITGTRSATHSACSTATAAPRPERSRSGPTRQPDPRRRCWPGERAATARALLERLPDAHRELLLLRVVAGLTAEQTGAASA